MASRPNPQFGSALSRQAGVAAGVHHPAVRRAVSHEPSLPGIVRQQQLLGNVIRYQVECEAGLLTVDCLNRRAGDLLPVGSAVTLVVARDQLCG